MVWRHRGAYFCLASFVLVLSACAGPAFESSSLDDLEADLQDAGLQICGVSDFDIRSSADTVTAIELAQDCAAGPRASVRVDEFASRGQREQETRNRTVLPGAPHAQRLTWAAGPFLVSMSSDADGHLIDAVAIATDRLSSAS